MKVLLMLLVLVGVGVVGLGFYRGWFSFASDSASAKSNYTLSVNTEKIQEDKKTAMRSVPDFKHKEPAAEKPIEGTVVSVSDAKLTMTGKNDKEHVHMLAADVKVTCDDKVCKAADLKPGMRVRVTGKHDAATRIEALDKNAGYANDRHDGKVVSSTDSKLVMTNMEGKEEHAHSLTADAKVTCDGVSCTAADLKPGMRIRVTTKHDDPHMATQIEALDKNPDFDKGG